MVFGVVSLVLFRYKGCVKRKREKRVKGAIFKKKGGGAEERARSLSVSYILEAQRLKAEISGMENGGRERVVCVGGEGTKFQSRFIRNQGLIVVACSPPPPLRRCCCPC